MLEIFALIEILEWGNIDLNYRVWYEIIPSIYDYGIDQNY